MMFKRLFPYLFLSCAVIAAAVVLILLLNEPDDEQPAVSSRDAQRIQVHFTEADIHAITARALAGQQGVSDVTVDLKSGGYGMVTFNAQVLGRSLPGTARARIRSDSRQVYIDLTDVQVSGQYVTAPDTSAATQELNRLLRDWVGAGYTIQSVETTETEVIVTAEL